MESFKGTPGPWFEHRDGFSTVYIEARIGGGMIQEVAACGPCDKGSDQQSANSRLIAAAPELLEALELILSYHDDGNCILHKEDVSMARAAINKALGEKQ